MKKVIFGILLNVVEKLKTFSMYYGWFSDYVWLNYRVYEEETKSILTNFNEKKATCKTQNLYILLSFLLTTLALLIAVII